MKKKEINLLIITISTKIADIVNLIDKITNKLPIVILSPHVVFENESKEIACKTNKIIRFISFYEFISEKEMIFCDNEADKKVLRKFKSRLGKLKVYFDGIKYLKNEIILNNIQKKYTINYLGVLSNDLGVIPEVWFLLSNHKHSNYKKYKSMDILNNIFNLFKKLSPSSFFSKIKKLFSFRFYNFHYDGRNALFLGEISRVSQYLNKKSFKITQVSSFHKLLLFTCIIVGKIEIKFNFNHFSKFLLKIFFKLTKYKNVVTTIHEYSQFQSFIKACSEFDNKNVICLQDGLLPENYESKYLNYMPYVDVFYVWSKNVKNFFRRNKLDAHVSNLFINQSSLNFYSKQPNLKKIKRTINILYIASGSGDWTALKNRSDEDLAFLAFCYLADNYPAINFIFRPHPLWVHSEHQGKDSIKRLIHFVSYKKFSNLKISPSVIEEARQNLLHMSLSKKFPSMETEIHNADIVIGDHSQSLIKAFNKGKLTISFNPSRRKSFFSSTYFNNKIKCINNIFELNKYINERC